MAPGERRRFGWLMVLLFLGSLLELAGVGIILPYLKVVGEPGLVLAHPALGPWMRDLGILEPGQVVFAASVATLVLFLVKAAGLGVLMRVSMKYFQQLGHSLSERLMDAYMKAGCGFHAQRNAADLVRNVTIECEQYSGVIKFLIILPTELIMVAGILALLFTTQALAALGAGAVVGLMAWGVAALTRRRLQRAGRQRSESHGRMIQWVNQGLGSLREARILGCEDFFVSSFSRQGESYRDALMEVGFSGQFPRLVIESAVGLCLVVIVFVALATGGDLPALIPGLSMLALALVRLVPSATRILSAMTGLRFYGPPLHSLLVEYQAARAAVEPADGTDRDLFTFKETLELQDAGCTYEGAETAAVSGISLTIQRGEMVALVGSSGAGKSTLAGLILGLLPPTTGRVLVDGRDIHENLPAWRRHLGYIPQDIYLLDDTLRRNVALGIPDEKIDDAAVWRALESAQLAEFVRLQAEGLDLRVGERGGRLSAGQRQRAGIARALYRDPELLVLDEATSALDNETERQFTGIITALAGRKTVIVIAHRLTTVRSASVICLMEAGKIVATGTYDELLERSPAFYRMAGLTPSPATV